MDRLISEQAVIDAICKVCAVEVKPSECRYSKGLFGGCKEYEAIKSIPSAEQSRDMEEIEEIINCDADAETKCKMISNILTAKPHYFEKQEPKTGHWIIIDDCEKFMAKCSECGQIEDSRMIGKYAYCHCGARMESEQNG